MTITRSVILDLWPVYASGDASDDTRALVDAFLRDDPQFAEQLTRDARIPDAPPALPLDTEAEAFVRLRRRLRGYPVLLNLAVLFSCFAFGRIVADTSWDVSPRNFIVTALIAVAFWTAFLVSLWRMRARILVVPTEPRRK
jgi:hypothetical protein